MKEHLSMKETLYISVMLFGLFFGAGNLIFPVYLGHMAGGNVWRAAAGFLITGVGLPLLGIAALGVSRSGGLLELSSRVGEKYGYFFTKHHVGFNPYFHYLVKGKQKNGKENQFMVQLHIFA